MKRVIAVLLLLSLAFGLVGCVSKEEKAAAQAVTTQIESLAGATLEDVAAVEEAQEAYEALTDKAKNRVKNYGILEEARTNLAASVKGMIDEIGAVTLDSRAAVDAAQTAYDSLPEDIRGLVDNYSVLEAASAELETMEQAAAVTAMIADIGTVTLDSEEAILAARTAYENLSGEAKALVENHADLETATSELLDVFHAEFSRLNEAVFAVADAMEIYDTVTMAALLEEYLPIAEKVTSSKLYVAEADLYTALKDTQDLLDQVCYPNTNIITLENYIKLEHVSNATPDEIIVSNDGNTGLDCLRYPFNSRSEMNNAFRAYQNYLKNYFEYVREEITPTESTYFYGMYFTYADAASFYKDDQGREFYIRWEYNAYGGSELTSVIQVGFDSDIGLGEAYGS